MAASAAAEAIGVESEIVSLAQGTLVTIAPERFEELAGTLVIPKFSTAKNWSK